MYEIAHAQQLPIHTSLFCIRKKKQIGLETCSMTEWYYLFFANIHLSDILSVFIRFALPAYENRCCLLCCAYKILTLWTIVESQYDFYTLLPCNILFGIGKISTYQVRMDWIFFFEISIFFGDILINI